MSLFSLSLPAYFLIKGGTDVTVFAPSTLDDKRLKSVADKVVEVTANVSSTCFCNFRFIYMYIFKLSVSTRALMMSHIF